MNIARISTVVLAAALLTFSGLTRPIAALADASGGAAIVGQIVDTDGGLPVAGATIVLYRGTTRVGETTTAGDGSFRFEHESPGVYSLRIAARGYQATQAPGIFVAANESEVAFRTSISRAEESVGSLKVIGREAVATRAALQTSATINASLSPDLLRKQNYMRVGDALNTLPGVNTSTSSAVGDDLSVSIRGFASSETATLLDGHPIGPIGAHGQGFDYQDSPFYGLRNVQVIFGSGANVLYGADTIAGAVNFQTLDPTAHPHTVLEQGVGNDGKMLTGLEATGTTSNGKLGYAFAHGVEGTYGNFAPQQITQTGLLAPDFTSANAAANTYSVSGNYLLRNDLLKLRYSFDPTTQLTMTAYAANSWDDKSGNGDTDYNSYQYALYNAQQTVASYGAGNPAPAGCPNGLVVSTDANPNQCVTPQQYAALAAGPAGGGPGPWQAIRNQDYHATLTKELGKSFVTVDGFIDHYAVDYNRSEAGGGFNSHYFNTSGILLSDDLTFGKNDFGFGYSDQNQQITGDFFNANPAEGPVNMILAYPEYSLGSASYFVRDQFTPSGKLSIFGNLWLRHSTVTGKSTFDPRVSVIFRPSNQDVVRLTGGHSDSEPAPQLRFGLPSLDQSFSNLNPVCGGNKQTPVGSVSNPDLSPETATDFELAYGHRFQRGDSVQLDVYTATEQNALFRGSLPVSQLGAGVIPPSLLNAYFARIQSFCGFPPTLANLAVTTYYNAAQALYRGIEVTGRYHASSRLYFDYAYDVQSAAYTGVPDSILMNNVTLINGSQVAGVPLHKAALGIDYGTPSGWELRLDEYYLDGNNGFNRPAFAYGNAFVSKTLRNTIVTLGVNNVFNDAVDSYGRIGLGVFFPENQFGTDTSALQQGSEQFGLPPRQVMLTVTQRI